jgi:hypothetical protein
MSTLKKLPVFALVGALAVSMVAFSSAPSFARGPGGGSNGANNPARSQLRRCLGNTCGISRTIDNAASKVYKRMQFWK